MKQKIVYLITISILTSCAVIPKESVQVAEVIQNEGKQMHELNVKLVNEIYREKNRKIDEFIEKEYTPVYLTNFFENVPKDTDLKTELPAMLEVIIPEINTRSNIMKEALEKTRLQIITTLQEDYLLYNQAVTELKNLLLSAVKVKDARNEALAKITQMTNKKIDVDKISGTLDDFIDQAGKTDISKIIKDLETTINGILKK